jgi:hypothetical protein
MQWSVTVGRLLFPIIVFMGAVVKLALRTKVKLQSMCQARIRGRSFLSGGLSIRIRRSTGREGDHMADNIMTQNRSIDSFIIRLSKTRSVCWPFYILRRRTAWVIIYELAATRNRGFSCAAYRGRAFLGRARPTSAWDFYWTEAKWQDYLRSGAWSPDRYNETGERVIYFSATAETAYREVRERNACDPVYIQEFRLDLPDIASVTLGHDLEQRFPHLNFLLLNSEFPRRGSHVENPYRATHFLSYACAVLGIDAVEYPSVKANLKANPNEFNIVLFRQAVRSAETMATGTAFLYP